MYRDFLIGLEKVLQCDLIFMDFLNAIYSTFFFLCKGGAGDGGCVALKLRQLGMILYTFDLISLTVMAIPGVCVSYSYVWSHTKNMQRTLNSTIYNYLPDKWSVGVDYCIAIEDNLLHRR